MSSSALSRLFRRAGGTVVLALLMVVTGRSDSAAERKSADAVRALEARGPIVVTLDGQRRVLRLAPQLLAVPGALAPGLRLPAGTRAVSTDAVRHYVQLPAGESLGRLLAAPRVAALGDSAAVALTPALAEPVFFEADRTDAPARYVATASLLLVGADAAVAAAQAAATGAAETTATAAPDLWLLRYASAYDMLAAAHGLERAGLAVEPQFARRRITRAAPNDPLYPRQFYFKNTGQNRGTPGVDLNIESLWPAASGSGITVAVVDDGLELTHPDLAPNVAADASLHANILGGGNDPVPPADANHGTICAGFIAARGNNGIGLTGAAPLARLLGVRLLGGDVTDAQEAAAFGWKTDVVHISSNSWGPDDDGATVSGPGSATLAALRAGVTTGRGGRGVVYVVATGNGRDSGDHAGFDGYSGSRYVIAVGATDNTGKQAAFSESGPQVLVVAAGQTAEGEDEQLLATDNVGPRGKNTAASPAGDYTTEETQGTSYSTPQVAGVAALMLEANARLGWRDVKEILIRTARRTDATDSDWLVNGGGFRFNHKYGAGFADAAAAVALARTWTNLGAEISVSQQSAATDAIPDNTATAAARTLTVTAAANFRVETVEVTVNATHAARGQLRFELTSPSGFRTVLGQPRTPDKTADLLDWTFSTPRHWGESAAGTWTVRAIDTVSGTTGSLGAVSVRIFGALATATAPTITTAPANVTAAVGGTATFTVAAAGTGLTYQWRRNGTALPGATAATLTLASVAATDAGSYDVVVTSAGLSTTSPAATLVVAPAGPTARLGNLSVRTALAAEQALTVGFVVSGGAKPVLIRAIGPTLGAFGVGGAHTDPKIELFSGSAKIDENDSWAASLAPTFASVGAFALTAGSADAALLRPINGAHTARIAGPGAGVILLEAYDAGTGNVPRIVNVSARNFVGTGGDILIAGFVVAGEGRKRVLLRAVGPTLAAFGVGGTLADPKLEIYDGAGAKVAENDDWDAALAPTFGTVGAFNLAARSLDAAIVLSLAPGAYTVQVRGSDGGTGEALIELYDLDN